MARTRQHKYKSSSGRTQGRQGSGRKTEKITSSYPRVTVKKPSTNGSLKTKAVRRIRSFLKSRGTLIPQRSFQHMVTVLFQVPEGKLRFELPASLALQEAAEAHLVELCEDWQLCAFHAKRVSVVASDIHLVQCLRGEKSEGRDRRPA